MSMVTDPTNRTSHRPPILARHFLAASGHYLATAAAHRVRLLGVRNADADCDGQILVAHDMLGLSDQFVPAFVKPYAALAETIVRAAEAYRDDVRAGRYPEKKPQPAAARST